MKPNRRVNLTVQVAAKSDDEVGKICSAFNSFVRKLHGAIARAASTAEQVASASEEIAAAAGQAANGADSQQQLATQAATAMQEMSSTVHQVADHSNRASEAARHAADTAKNGGKVVEASLASMRSIAGSVKDTAGKVAELGKSSNQIGLIVNVIDDIADQTNLLALNAAIEAARAGEQGRGFAVVADEVRKLAERTTKATKEIAEMITAIQEETKRAIGTMETVTVQVEHGVGETAKAGESLHEIIRAADTVGDMITQIATAATQQSAATEEVSTSVEQIAKITQESSAGRTAVGPSLPGAIRAGGGSTAVGQSIPPRPGTTGRGWLQRRPFSGPLRAANRPPQRTKPGSKWASSNRQGIPAVGGGLIKRPLPARDRVLRCCPMSALTFKCRLYGVSGADMGCHQH